MDRERDRDSAEELIDDAKRRLGADEPTRRPEQGTDKPGGDEGTSPEATGAKARPALEADPTVERQRS